MLCIGATECESSMMEFHGIPEAGSVITTFAATTG
jgi:hypothetical protein